MKFTEFSEGMPMGKILNLDLDGVIVDLDTLVRERTGTHWKEQPSSSKMWAIIREVIPDMFVIANPMKDAKQLVAGVLAFADENGLTVEILTAVPKLATFPQAVEQKKQWLSMHFPELAALKFKIGPHAVDKQKHAGPGDILIDDNHMNIEQWDAAGGIAIYHKNATSSLAALYSL